MISLSSAMLPAARIICSNCKRFIDLPPFSRAENAAEWAGLPQTCPPFIRRKQYPEDLAQWPIEDFAPLAPNRGFTVSLYPSTEIPFCYFEKLRMSLQAAGNLLVKLKTPLLNSFVIRPHGKLPFLERSSSSVARGKSMPDFHPLRAKPFQHVALNSRRNARFVQC